MNRMDDSISRQAAIRAVNTALFPKINTAKDAEKALRDLPSVQPEKRTEERTETHACDCISRQAAIDALIELYEYQRDIDPTEAADLVRQGIYLAEKKIEQLPAAQQEQRWIPCSERLPENRLYVLVTYKYEYGLIDHGITWYGQAGEKWDTSREVIAWMPLPEPYREGEQDENR